MKILIAEDDFVSRKYLFKLLSRYGDCDLVVDGVEALDAFVIGMKEQNPYDLISLDIMMPKLDGVRVLKYIRDYETQKGIMPKKRAKVIMTTALAEAQFVKNAFEIGCDAYIAKPIDANNFVEELFNLKLIEDKGII